MNLDMKRWVFLSKKKRTRNKTAHTIQSLYNMRGIRSEQLFTRLRCNHRVVQILGKHAHADASKMSQNEKEHEENQKARAGKNIGGGERERGERKGMWSRWQSVDEVNCS